MDHDFEVDLQEISDYVLKKYVDGKRMFRAVTNRSEDSKLYYTSNHFTDTLTPSTYIDNVRSIDMERLVCTTTPFEFLNRLRDKDIGDQYQIHDINYRVALQPTYLIGRPDELWLVPYSEMFKEYEAGHAAEIIVKEHSHISSATQELSDTQTKYAVEVKTGSFYFSPRILPLSKGYWEIHTRRDRIIQYYNITANEYFEIKEKALAYSESIENLKTSLEERNTFFNW